MKILAIGGTGAMGKPMVSLLSENGNDITVTSRSKHMDSDHVHYIQGNAQSDINFIKTIFANNNYYDVIVDFMVYDLDGFKSRLPLYLSHTYQYIFFSSSRVYANSEKTINEESARLLDTCTDNQYLQTDEYALAKAREENCLLESKERNWTIIRPYITYNTNRLQLGVYEKENWLYRALKGHTIIFPSDIAEHKTTMTFGPDVAKYVCRLIGNEKALGEIFTIAGGGTLKWKDILSIYMKTYKECIGKDLSVLFIDSSDGLEKVWDPWQVKYDRLYNREFDNSKLINITGIDDFKSIDIGLTESLKTFLQKPEWLKYHMNWKYEAWSDRLAHERTPLKFIDSSKEKVRYIKYRYL